MKSFYRKIFSFSVLQLTVYIPLAHGQAQVIISNTSCTTAICTTLINQQITARDKIIIQPKTSIQATPNNESRLYIDKTIHVPSSPASYISQSSFYSSVIPLIDFSLPVGTTPGQGSVTPSGQATYNIPITVPPGTKGMEPSLSIYYNSGLPDGLAGRGWSITGLSAITRVPKDHYHDGVKKGIQLDGTDVFARDGIRIIGNRLENDNFSIVTFSGGFFTVETKEGLIMKYGNNTNSQLIVTDPSGSNVPFTWYLSELSDKYGNFISYIYDNNTTGKEVVIREINYTGNTTLGRSPYNSIKFSYGVRKDKRERYILGNRLQSTLILRIIVIQCEGIMKKYEFEYGYDDFYEQSFLSLITEQGSDLSKLNTTYIKYGEGVAPSASGSNIVLTTGSLPAVAEYRSGDFNGDGKSDLLAFEYNAIDGHNGRKTYTTCKIFINQGLTGSNNATTQFQKMPQEINMTNKIPYSFSDFMSDYAVSPYGLQTADFNGDGKDDLLLGTNVGGIIIYTPYYANFSGTGFTEETSKNFQINENHAFVLADINGDGKYEGVFNTGTYISVRWIDDAQSSSSFSVSGCGACGPSSFSGLASIDFDGDGTHELISMQNGIMAILKINATPSSNNASVSRIYIDGSTPSAYSQNFFGDFNGDGITDNIKVRPMGTNIYATDRVRIRFGTGTGYVKSNGTTANSFSTMEQVTDGYPFYSQRKYMVADINNDGKSDLVGLEYPTCGSSDIYILAMLGGTTKIITIESVLGCAPPAFDYSHPVAGNSSISNYDPNIPCNTWPVQDCGSSAIICGSQTSNPYLPLFPANTNYAYLIPEFVTGDFNGDGKQDIFLKSCASQNSSVSYSIIYFDKGNFAGQPTAFSTRQFVTVIADGFRAKTKFKYSPITNPNPNLVVYTKGNNPQYPVIDFQQLLYVVAEFSEPDGTGSEVVTTYKYENAHVHLKGKGFLGFDNIITTTAYNTNPSVQIKSISNFSLNNTYFEKILSSTQTFNPPATLIADGTRTSFIVTTTGGNAPAHYTQTTQIITRDLVSGKKVTRDILTYDNSGNVTHSLTAIGNTVNQNAIETTEVLSPYISAGNSYGILNVPASVTTTVIRTEDAANPYPRTIQYSYYPTGNVSQIISDPAKLKSVQTNYFYNASGALVRKQVTAGNNPLVRETNFMYDAQSRFVIQTINPSGQNSFATYNSKWGKPLTETGIDGLVTKYQYDGYGRTKNVTTPDNLIATIDYAWVQPGSLNTADYTATTFGSDIISNALYSITNQRPGSPASRTIYDIYSRELASDADGFNNKVFSANKYDARGNIFKQSGTYENIPGVLTPVITTNLYDNLNRIINSQTVSANISIPATTFTYTFPNPKNGNTIVTTSIPASATTGAKTFIKTTDGSGLLKSAQDIGGTISYSYSSNRQLKSTTVGTNATNTIEYDEYGRQTELFEANSGQTLYEYDAYGNLISQIDAANNQTAFQYDILDRVTQKIITPPSPATPLTCNYIYHPVNNLLQTVNGSNNISYSYTYDNLNRIVKTDQNIEGNLFSTLFAYDQFSNVIKETFPSGFAVAHSYDINGYHNQIKRDDNNQIIYTANSMNALGQYTSFTQGNGMQTTKSYTDFGFPTMFSTNKGFINLLSQQFTFDQQNGNLINRTNDILSETFTYDNLDRLKTSNFGGLTLNYSLNGNIQNKSDATTGLNTYLYDPVKVNALKRINNPTSNISQLFQNIIYTPFHKAQTITEDLNQLDFTYGPDEQRKKTTLLNNSVLQSTRFFSGDYEKTISGSNTTEVHYINCGAGLAAMYVVENGNGTMYFPYTDYLGSILTVTDQQGNIAAEQSFDAWGRNRNPVDWTDQNIPTVPSWLYRGFTMHEHLPEFTLINMNGRMYDPIIGRMLSPDNNLQAPDYSQNHNRYSYALNNPLKFVDLSGSTSHTWDAYGSGSDWFGREFNTTSEFDREHFRYLGSIGGHIMPSGDFVSNQTIVYEAHKKWIQNLQSSEPYGITYDAMLTAGVWSDPETGWINRVEDVTITGFVSEEGIYGYLKEQGRQKALEYYRRTGELTGGGPKGGAIESSGLLGLGPLEFLLPLPKGSSLFKTATNTERVFWSGGTMAREAAENFAKEQGMKTLGMTNTGRLLTGLERITSYGFTKPLWKMASANFARGASGTVNVFHNASTGIGLKSIWSTTEYSILKTNKVDFIYHNILK